MAGQTNIGAMRKPYNDASNTFDFSHLAAKEPFGQFKAWFDEAAADDRIYEPNAMSVATATKDGVPSVRLLLLKSFGNEGFVFFTNYGSRKGKEIAENPRAALMFYWEPMKRSVRVEGTVQKLSEKESEEYFHSRPVGSQIGAAISNQSTVIPSREYLQEKEEALKKEYGDGSKVLPKPDFWGGFVVVPTSFEFWQGQSTRIHDRLKFRKLAEGEKINEELTKVGDDGWVIERLSP